MDLLRSMVGIILASGLALAAVGCETDGPVESAGENVDEAVEDTREAAEEAGE